jgi:hypothetical protein
MVKPQKTQWFTIDVCGRDVTVNLYQKLSGCYGEHRPDKGEVAIKWVECNGIVYDTLLHEVLVHAIFEGSGLREELKKTLGMTDEKWMEIEEKIAHTWTPCALATMKRAGWLCLPCIPEKEKP